MVQVAGGAAHCGRPWCLWGGVAFVAADRGLAFHPWGGRLARHFGEKTAGEGACATEGKGEIAAPTSSLRSSSGQALPYSSR